MTQQMRDEIMINLNTLSKTEREEYVEYVKHLSCILNDLENDNAVELDKVEKSTPLFPTEAVVTKAVGRLATQLGTLDIPKLDIYGLNMCANIVKTLAQLRFAFLPNTESKIWNALLYTKFPDGGTPEELMVFAETLELLQDTKELRKSND